MLECLYLILTEGEWHAFVVASNLDVAVAERLEGIVYRVLELVIALGRH